jgi:hypothetical protein
MFMAQTFANFSDEKPSVPSSRPHEADSAIGEACLLRAEPDCQPTKRDCN